MIVDIALAEACQSAYSDPATWQRGNCHAVLAGVGDAHIVAFRGTNDARDWLVDFEACPKQYPGLGWCHEGFLDDVLGLSGQIQEDVAGKRVIVTGHSKGGAEALIFAGLLVLAGMAPAAVVTFGAPRAGVATLRQVLDQVPVRQYRHGNDPVPAVPLELAGWRHVREPLLQIGQPSLDPIADHFIEGYRSALA